VASALAATSSNSSTTWEAPGSTAFSASRVPLVSPRPMPNTMSPCTWERAAPRLPRMPNVSRRLAAVLATAVTSSANRFAACAVIGPLSSRNSTT
jgi:hypothetical protein